MKNFSLLLAPLILISACNKPENEMHLAKLCDSEIGYCIVGLSESAQGWTKNWSDINGDPTSYTASNQKEGEDYLRLDFYNGANCNPKQLGITNVRSQNGILWGEVDERNDGTFSSPNCRVKSIYPEKNQLENWTAYGMCSEKNGRSVVICMMQVTKNPELARQIFATFRWTE